MTWIRLDDSFADHPKIIDAGTDAAWLYVAGLCYAARHLTDGRIPRAAIRQLSPHTNPPKLAKRLLDVTLWESRADGAYQIHDYLDYNPAAADVRAQRQRDASRKTSQESGRNPGGIRPDSTRPVPLPHKEEDRSRDDADEEPTAEDHAAWAAALDTLRRQMTDANYQIWLADTIAVGRRGDTLLVAAQSEHTRQWLETRMRPLIRRALHDADPTTADVAFTTSPRPALRAV